MRRRRFLGAGIGSAAALAGGLGSWLAARAWAPAPEVRIVGGPQARGHLLRAGGLPEPSEERETGVLIVGGGMAGLSAGWELGRAGCRDFLCLELDDEAGGNARSGRNGVSAYPWGAHYVPLPGPALRFARELFEELGVIRGYDAAGLPVYEPEYLCAAPDERLFIHGQWQGGLVPEAGVPAAERAELQAFFREMERYRAARGRDGRRAFAIPVDESSTDERFTRLDKLTMERYLEDELRLRAPSLRWYVDYCCRDDYGTPIGEVSAWAGVHYFASREGKASGVGGHPVLTWPEGNGWLVGKLRDRLGDRVLPAAVAFRVRNDGGGVSADVFLPREGRSVRIRARSAVVAVPRFVAARIVSGLPAEAAAGFTYAPWMVANLTLRIPPEEQDEWQTWDNVLQAGPSLGYVVATHQTPAFWRARTVLTYYQPLTGATPEEARREALGRAPGEWRARIVADLSRAHPRIEERLERIDVWLWGHAMIRPLPGFVTGEARRAAAAPLGRIHFAHSDLSGISIFEEAQYRGVLAARGALRDLRGLA